MSSKEQTQRGDKAGAKRPSAKSATEDLDVLVRQQSHPAVVIQQARLNPGSLTPANIRQLQRTLGNRTVGKLLSGVKPGSVIQAKIEPGKLNLVGENHDESEARRGEEKAMLASYGFSASQYWEENTFQYSTSGANNADVTRGGDSLVHLVLQSAAFLLEEFDFMKRRINFAQATLGNAPDEFDATVDDDVDKLIKKIEDVREESKQLGLAADRLDQADEYPDVVDAADAVVDHIDVSLTYYLDEVDKKNRAGTLANLLKSVEAIEEHIRQEILKDYDVATAGPKDVATQIVRERSLAMYMAAEMAAEKNGKTGVWKIGNEHAGDLKDGMQNFNSERLGVTLKTEFDAEFKAWEQKQGKS